MEKSDIDTINGSLPAIIRSIDVTQQFLSLLKSYCVFSDEMIGDILVSTIFLYPDTHHFIHSHGNIFFRKMKTLNSNCVQCLYAADLLHIKILSKH